MVNNEIKKTAITDEELRLECLKLATLHFPHTSITGFGLPPDYDFKTRVKKDADSYVNYVRNGTLTTGEDT